MNYYSVEQQERISLPAQLSVNFDTTGYPIAPVDRNQPISVSATSKKNSLLFFGGLVLALAGAGTIGHYLGASGEAQKAQQQQIELMKARSGIAEFCKQHNQ